MRARADFEAYAVRQGLSQEYAALLNMLYGWIGENRFAELADGVQQVLHREPRDVTDYIRAAAATGVWHG
ncbi:hypothetical protein [Streptomyces sp. NBC_00467]|uniref:hypothetical protein n=1 Tax=Streptomyces sp. NBC_00467 TaxID=2975752 RepID=UPI002E187E14